MADRLIAPVGIEQIVEFYGFDADQHLREGLATPAWEAKMCSVEVPAPMFFGTARVRSVRVHRGIAAVVRETLVKVHEARLWPVLENYSGGYTFRQKHGSDLLSMHAFGAALDFDAVNNARGKAIGDTVLGGSREGWKVVLLFESLGWTWGGWWRPTDAMHFQWGSGY